MAEDLIYIFARDITSRKHAEQEIQRLNVELQHRVNALIEVNRELEAFNYSISHDLRAPLRSMQSFSQALLEDTDSKLSPDAVDFLGRIMRSGKYMDNLLRDLLAYSRLARIDFHTGRVDLDQTLREVLNQFHKDIKDRKARIEIPSPLGSVMANQPILKQILANLIGNALKFVEPTVTPQITITSKVVTFSDLQPPTSDPSPTTSDLGPPTFDSVIRVTIDDNGIGIHPDHHKKIFGLFERLHPNQAYAGTGIGLALVRKGIERLGGDLGLDSSPGHGSRFWFELPSAV
jgi:signal transduction histidine kinase